VGWNGETQRATQLINTLPHSVRGLFRSLELTPLEEFIELEDSAEFANESPLSIESSQHRFGYADASVMKAIGLVEPGLMIIRPDGYLAAAGTMEDESIVVEWLQSLS